MIVLKSTELEEGWFWKCYKNSLNKSKKEKKKMATKSPTKFQKKVIEFIKKSTKNFENKNKKDLAFMRTAEKSLMKDLKAIIEEVDNYVKIEEKSKELNNDNKDLKFENVLELIDELDFGCNTEKVKQLSAKLMGVKYENKNSNKTRFPFNEKIEKMISDFNDRINAIEDHQSDLNSELISNLPNGVCIQTTIYWYNSFKIRKGNLKHSMQSIQYSLDCLGRLFDEKLSASKTFNTLLAVPMYDMLLLSDSTAYPGDISYIFRPANPSQIENFVMHSEINFEKLYFNI